ncbi:hypothetical protein D3C80_559300 [compost metagenome]
MMCQPAHCEGRRRVNDQSAVGLILGAGKGLVDHFEGRGDLWSKPCAGIRQHHLPRPTQEKLLSQCVFQKLDLIADGRLRQSEFLACTGETHVPRRRFEDAQAVQRKLLRHLHGSNLFMHADGCFVGNTS